MTETTKSPIYARLPLPLWFLLVVLTISSLTRLTLVALNTGELRSALWYLPLSLAVGLLFDVLVGLYATLPLVVLMLFFRLRWLTLNWARGLFSVIAWLFTFGLLYLSVVELFFFGEFDSRFNYVAVDYLIYPHEVFVNLWETYPVLSVMIGCALAALAVTFLTRGARAKALARSGRLRNRVRLLVVYVGGLFLGTLGLNINLSRVSDNRTMNEITGNGIYSFAHAGLTNELDYNQYYACMDKRAMTQRLRRLLDDSHTTFLDRSTDGSIERRVESDLPLNRFNVVLVIEESFGSKFVGSLKPDGKCLTPRFDSLAAEHGLLFRHVYATGNRTVRGIEASLASYPPIPGRSIVKRPDNEHIFTLSSLLKSEGYSTVFMYGGLSYFDNVGHFAENNGYDQVIDELDFDDPVFKTIWGVCDEDLFDKSLTVFDSLHTLGKPFFATLLTVSNHSPFTYPEGRIPFDPEERRRDNAVRYADYAIGKIIEDARSHDYFDSTLFVFMADHGARVYGSEQIPMRSYEIPLLFYSSALNPTGRTCDVLGSQMDVAPTILDYLGFSYNSEFFGRSLLSTSKDEERVLMSHNRDVSLLEDDTLAVLGIQGNADMWEVDDADGGIHRVNVPTDSSLIEDAVAYYMTAYDMFSDHRLHPLAQ